MTKKFNVENTDKIKAEAERFLILFEKSVNEYHKKINRGKS